MYSLADPLFWINFIYFLVAVFVAFYIPGSILIKKLNLNFLSECVLSLVTGFVIWSILGFVLGYLNARFLLYLYLILSSLLWLKFISFKLTKNIKIQRTEVMLLIVILIGSVIQLSSVWFNGILFKDGLYFCCGVPDTIFHLALTNDLIKNFPPNEPGISNVALNNYHYLSNLAIADLVRIFKLPLINTQYQYMTVLFSVLLGLSAVTLGNILKLDNKFKLAFTFLIYTAGDIIFLLTFITRRVFDFSYTTLENASSLWISPPRFYAIVVFLVGLSLFLIWLREKKPLPGILMAFVLGSLIGFKIYVGAIILAGFSMLALLFVFKRQFNMLLPLILTFIVSLILYFPINLGAGGLVFTGFWRFEDFATQQVLGLSSLELARRIFLDNNNYLRAIIYDIGFGLSYVFFSAGILILGFLQTKKSLEKIPKEFILVTVSGLIATSLAGFFFIQKTGGSNSSQFLISIYIIGSIYAALSISWLIHKISSRTISYLVIALFMLITSARVTHDTIFRIENIISKTGTFIDNESLNSYRYFANTKNDSVVMVFEESSLDCILITFIGNRSTYSCTSGAPADRGINLETRLHLKNILLSEKNPADKKLTLKKAGISHLYILKNSENIASIEKNKLLKVYENKKVVIYNLPD